MVLDTQKQKGSREMTQTIEQLTARVRELEEENARLKAAVEYAETIRVENIAYFEKQLATSQLSETQLREALQTYIDEHEECQDADDWMAMMCSMEAHHAADKALSQPSDISSLVSFVAEEVKELDEANEYHRQLARVSRDNELKATKQRDLAVEALNAWLGIASNCSIESGCCCCGESIENHSSPMMCGHSPVDMADSVVRGAIQKTDEALSAIKESEGK